MQRYKRLLTLVVVLAVVCAATVGLTQYMGRQDQMKNDKKIVAHIPTEEILSFSWQNPDGSSFAFRKTDSGWKYQDEAFPLHEERLLDILKAFENLTASFVIENVTDFAQYGLVNPKITINVSTADSAYTFKMGSFSPIDEHRYADKGDGNVYLLENDPAGQISSNLSVLLKRDTIPSFDSPTEITFAGLENYTITRNEEGNFLAQRAGETVSLDTASVQQYLQGITGLDIINDVTYNATEEDLKTYGLDAPQLIVTVNYTQQNPDGTQAQKTCALHIGENAEERAAADKAAEEGKIVLVTKYGRLDGSNIVYKLYDADYEALITCSYNDFTTKN